MTEHFLQPKISGYRQLSEDDAAKMNDVKALAEQVGALIERMIIDGQLDTRWVATARTTLQTGFMQLVRSIAQPTTF